VIDRNTRTILGLVFSERTLRLLSRSVGNKHKVLVFTQVWSWLQANLLLVLSPRPTLSALRTILRFGHSHSVAPRLKE
jgi:hypothetical protein